MKYVTFIGINLAIILTASVFIMGSTKSAAAATLNTFINIDLSNTVNPADITFGINCDDSQYAWVTLYTQGALVKIDKVTKEVVKIYDDPKGALTAGQDFYSIARDPTGNLFVADRLFGLMWRFSPNTESWDSVKLTNSPEAFQMDTFAGGNVWTALTDTGFAGLAKIDPTTLEVTKIPIAGAAAPAAITVDSSDSNILWVTDRGNDKLYKFDLTRETVVETISLPLGPEAHNVATDSNFIYVPLDSRGEDSSRNQILRISKSDTTTRSIITTGVASSPVGPFAVFIIDDTLYWTDKNRHVGTINLSNNEKAFDTTSFADFNFFGCRVGDEFWFTGQGSAEVGYTGEVGIKKLVKEASHFRAVSTGMVKSDAAVAKYAVMIIEADYECGSGNKIVPQPRSLTGILKIDGVLKEARSISFKQLNTTSYRYHAAAGSFANLVGTANFSSLDCTNNVGHIQKTSLNDMKLIQRGVPYRLINTSDSTTIRFT